MGPYVNPAMVVAARESRGMLQCHLAEAAGVQPSRLSKIENSLIQAGDGDIDRIAPATRYRRAFFYRQDTLIGLGSSLLFNRKQKTALISIQRQVQARVNVARIQIERLLQAAEVDSAVRMERLDVDACDGGPREVARRIRAALRLPMGPVHSVTRAIESAGGIIALCNFGARQVDGAHLWLPGSQPMFFMNADAPGDRHRFNLAHELGHCVMHEFPAGDIEKQANEFAAEFLMPSDEIGHELRGLSIERAAELKQRWKVSMSALIYNAHVLGCITESRRKSLYTLLRSMMRGHQEPIEIVREDPVILRQLVQVHRRALGYGDEELRELFMMDDPDFIELPDDVRVKTDSLRIERPPMRITDFPQRRLAGQ